MEWWKPNPASSGNPPQCGSVNRYWKTGNPAISWPTIIEGDVWIFRKPKQKRVWVRFIPNTEINQTCLLRLHFAFSFWETFGYAFANPKNREKSNRKIWEIRFLLRWERMSFSKKKTLQNAEWIDFKSNRSSLDELSQNRNHCPYEACNGWWK